MSYKTVECVAESRPVLSLTSLFSFKSCGRSPWVSDISPRIRQQSTCFLVAQLFSERFRLENFTSKILCGFLKPATLDVESRISSPNLVKGSLSKSTVKSNEERLATCFPSAHGRHAIVAEQQDVVDSIRIEMIVGCSTIARDYILLKIRIDLGDCRPKRL